MAEFRKMLKNGRQQWRVRVSRRCRDGSRKSVTRWRRTLRECRELVPEMMEILAAKADSEKQPQRMRFAVFAAQWLERRVKTRKASTVHGDASKLTTHVLPALGGYWLDDLKPRDIARYLDSLTGKGLSARTVTNHLTLLRAMARDAVAAGVIEHPFTRSIRAPSVKQPYTDAEPGLLTPAQLGQALEHVSPHWRACVLVLAFTGLRWSEVSALGWDDIDREAGILRVWRAQVRGILDSTKTPASARRIPLVPEVMEALDEHRRSRVAAQHAGVGSGWVFPSSTGGLYRSWPVTSPLRTALKKAGIEAHVTAHGLRRTFNNIARQVTDDQIVRDLVGHVDAAMTRHYSRSSDRERREAIDNVIAMVRGDDD